jgi:hypothetical protein
MPRARRGQYRALHVHFVQGPGPPYGHEDTREGEAGGQYCTALYCTVLYTGGGDPPYCAPI